MITVIPTVEDTDTFRPPFLSSCDNEGSNGDYLMIPLPSSYVVFAQSQHKKKSENGPMRKKKRIAQVTFLR